MPLLQHELSVPIVMLYVVCTSCTCICGQNANSRDVNKNVFKVTQQEKKVTAGDNVIVKPLSSWE